MDLAKAKIRHGGLQSNRTIHEEKMALALPHNLLPWLFF
jgi:hypothetical protein